MPAICCAISSRRWQMAAPRAAMRLPQRLQLWQSHRHGLAICRHLLLSWHCAGQQYVADVLQCQRSGQPTLAGVFDAGANGYPNMLVLALGAREFKLLKLE